jgi:hypothetical protein
MKKLIVHTIIMGDVEDPDLFVAEPMYKWQTSEIGKWVIENAIHNSVVWHRNIDNNIYGYRYVITAKFEDADATFFMLKYNNITKK